MNLWAMSVDISLVSAGGTGKETVEVGVGNDTDSEGVTVSDTVRETCIEIWNRLKECNISRY